MSGVEWVALLVGGVVGVGALLLFVLPSAPDREEADR